MKSRHRLKPQTKLFVTGGTMANVNSGSHVTPPALLNEEKTSVWGAAGTGALSGVSATAATGNPWVIGGGALIGGTIGAIGAIGANNQAEVNARINDVNLRDYQNDVRNIQEGFDNTYMQNYNKNTNYIHKGQLANGGVLKQTSFFPTGGVDNNVNNDPPYYNSKSYQQFIKNVPDYTKYMYNNGSKGENYKMDCSGGVCAYNGIPLKDRYTKHSAELEYNNATHKSINYDNAQDGDYLYLNGKNNNHIGFISVDNNGNKWFTDISAKSGFKTRPLKEYMNRISKKGYKLDIFRNTNDYYHTKNNSNSTKTFNSVHAKMLPIDLDYSKFDLSKVKVKSKQPIKDLFNTKIKPNNLVPDIPEVSVKPDNYLKSVKQDIPTFFNPNDISSGEDNSKLTKHIKNYKRKSKDINLIKPTLNLIEYARDKGKAERDLTNNTNTYTTNNYTPFISQDAYDKSKRTKNARKVVLSNTKRTRKVNNINNNTNNTSNGTSTSSSKTITKKHSTYIPKYKKGSGISRKTRAANRRHIKQASTLHY